MNRIICLLPEARLLRSQIIPMTAFEKKMVAAAMWIKRAWLSSSGRFMSATKASLKKIAAMIMAAMTAREIINGIFVFESFFMRILNHR